MFFVWVCHFLDSTDFSEHGETPYNFIFMVHSHVQQMYNYLQNNFYLTPRRWQLFTVGKMNFCGVTSTKMHWEKCRIEGNRSIFESRFDPTGIIFRICTPPHGLFLREKISKFCALPKIVIFGWNCVVEPSWARFQPLKKQLFSCTQR